MFAKLLDMLGIKPKQEVVVDPTSIFGASVAASERFHNEMMTPARRYGGPNYSAF
jgi:hypothetical protein